MLLTVGFVVVLVGCCTGDWDCFIGCVVGSDGVVVGFFRCSVVGSWVDCGLVFSCCIVVDSYGNDVVVVVSCGNDVTDVGCVLYG